MRLLKTTLLLCGLALPALAGEAKVQYPEWVNRGSGAFKNEKGGQAFYGVGAANHLKGKPTEPLGWVAFLRAVSQIGGTINTYVEKLTKDYGAAASEKSPPGAIKAVSEFSFGELKFKKLDKDMEETVDGKPGGQYVSSALKATSPKGDPGFLYQDFAESRTAGDMSSSEENQEITLTQSKGSEAILAELRAGGVRLAAVWTDPDGAVYALAQLDLDSLKAAQKQPDKPLTKQQREAADKAFEEFK